jgi:TonB family protein
MRRILVASLLFTIALTAAAASPKPANDASTPATPMVTTGVTSAQLRYAAKIELPPTAALASLPNPAKMVLKLNLDQTGSPTHVEVVRSLTPELDARVVKAVRQFRWSPAVLDNQTIPIDVNLIVEVQH